MPAETAVAADEIAAGQEEGKNGADAQEQKQQEVLSAPIGDRLKGILENMNLPTDVLETTLGGEEKSAEQQEEEEAGAEEEEKAEEIEAKPKPDEELTEEQKTQWAPEALARIHKTTAQREKFKSEAATERARREEVERENAELKARAQVPPPALQPTAANPLAQVQSIEQLGQTKAMLEQWRSWARRNPNGALDVVIGKDAKGENILQDFTPEEVAVLEDEIDLTLSNALPAQAKFIQERTMHNAIAQVDFPEIYSGNETEERAMAREILRSMPELLRLPDVAVQLGIFVRARKAYDAEKAGKKKVVSKNPSVAAFTRPQPLRAPSLPRVQRPATEPVEPDQDVKAAEERAVANAGSPDSMVDLVRSLRRAQGNRRNGQRLASA